MPRQVHATHQTRRQEMDELAESDAAAQNQARTALTDELLDEIDLILEEEDEFLIRYRARGGQ